MDVPVLKNLEFEMPGKLAPSKTIEDLPPEVLTIILEFVTLDANKKNMLACRLVHSQWKEIMDSLIEKGIVSSDLSSFPEMSIAGDDGTNRNYDQLHLRLPPSRFSVGRNPFPFNSLHFNGTAAEDYNDPNVSHVPILSLAAFSARFGGNLTRFSLHDQLIPVKTLVEMLSSMANLKRLSLKEVFEATLISEEEPVFPPAPPLPFPTNLELAFRMRYLFMNDKLFILYVWLFVSYAEQLVRLDLEAGYNPGFPPLQSSHNYTYRDFTGKTCQIATTSKSAFRNLKELNTSDHVREFLILSETPALKRFAAMGAGLNVEFEDLTIFIGKCATTLEELIVNAFWFELPSDEAFKKFKDGERPLLLPRSVAPILKTVTIRYPHADIYEMMLSEFLTQFPALEKLQLLYFRPHEEDDQGIVMQSGNESNSQNADEIGALKEQLASILQRMRGISNNIWVAKGTLARLVKLRPEAAEDEDERHQLDAEIAELRNTKIGARMERVGIFNRLAALGENTKKLMAQQMLERSGIWNTCPRLKVVSVSTAGIPNGDVVCFEDRMMLESITKGK